MLSPEGFLYMVTVMDNDPAEILQLLAEDGIEGGYLLILWRAHHFTFKPQEQYRWHAVHIGCLSIINPCSHPWLHAESLCIIYDQHLSYLYACVAPEQLLHCRKSGLGTCC